MTFFECTDDLTGEVIEVFVPCRDIAEMPPAGQVFILLLYTVFEVLNKVCEAADIQIEYSWTPMYNSYYIEGINHLYEFDVGPESGWMYKVDEWFPNYGCSAYKLKDGQDIVWCYTCNGYGADVGEVWMG